MSGKKPLRLGGRRRDGEATCGFGVDENHCAKPGVWHLLWLHDDSASVACEDHLEYIDSRSHPGYEKHTMGPNCTMPGCWWHHPYDDEEEGYCFFPANDDASALLAEAPITAEAIG